MRAFALLGHPVHHSLSPALHNGWFADAGTDDVYVTIDLPAARAHQAAGLLRTLGLRGANLTVPLKSAVLGALDRVEGDAAILGAVNTVVREGDALVGLNTDAPGFMAGLREVLPQGVSGAEAVVLGAGGAGAAVVCGLLRGGARVRLVNRSLGRAQQVAARLSGVGGVVATPWSAEVLAGADVVVVCTSGGARDALSSLAVSGLPAHAVVVDINYWMDAPPLLVAARSRGLRTQDGLPMLIHQAALAFHRFTGISPSVEHARARVG